MSGAPREIRKLFLCLALGFAVNGINTGVLAQQVIGLSVGYEHFPYVKLADPSAEAPDLEIQARSTSVGASFPLVFARGKLLVLNQINYRRTHFDYRNFPEDGNEIEQAQSIAYTLFMIDSLSQKWKLVAALTPGLASDFEGDVTSDDFSFEGVLGAIRRYGENLELGLGLSYTRDFGPPLPLPFLYFDWTISSRLHANGIIPVNADVSYSVSPRVDLGVSLTVKGNRYHGDPDIYDVDNPQMEYSEGTVSPRVQLHLLRWLHLSVEGGFALYRNFEFLDGDDSEASYDLEETGYLRAGLVLGM
jgi:hypothetical protein